MTIDIKTLILDTYTTKPKHFTQILKRNSSVIEYVNTHASHLTNFLEQLYYVVYNESNVCPNGNIKQLKTFAGYSFCGKAGICKCAKDSVSASVAKSKSEYTTEIKNAINNKKETTNLSKYGVKNTGLLEKSKENHAKFYTDSELVSNVIARIKNTKLLKYNDENYNNRDKAEETCLVKYGVKNTWSLSEDKQNPNLDLLRDKDMLATLFPKLSVQCIADTYKLHAQTVYYYLNKHGFREPYKSTFEKEIVFYLESLGITNIITNKRSIIGKELDIFLPDYNLAIEYNGIYWHHDKIQHITPTYHYEKFKKCEDIGIELFTIFSDSWGSCKEIWKRKIKMKLKLSDRRIYARNTKVVDLTAAQTRDILDNNHIQGYCTAEYCYGLMYDTELVAVMTFSSKRTAIGKNYGDNSFELVRYVTSCTVVGGASKLLSHFIKSIAPNIVYSFSDNQYSVGNLYKQLGFSLVRENKAGYRYYNPDNKISYHRYNFSKHKLVALGYDEDKTEKVIMDERGFLRIWDCGTRTWCIVLK